MDRFPDPRIGAAPADIGNRLIDRIIVRVGIRRQQGSHTHDHARLAIAALRDLFIDPGLLHGMQPILASQSFDRRDRFALQVRNRQYARSNRLAIDVDGAGTALRNPAPVFCASELKNVAQRPQCRHGLVDINAHGFSVEVKLNHD